MALLQELTDYRKKIMQMLCSDQEIVDLILNRENSTVPDRSLMYSRVFPYAYTPDETKNTNTYICFRIYVPEVMNKTVKKMGVCFYVFSHQDNIRTSNGLRPDLIGVALERIFNGSLDLGLGRMQLEGIDDISPATDFHGIAIEYSVLEYNRPSLRGDKGR